MKLGYGISEIKLVAKIMMSAVAPILAIFGITTESGLSLKTESGEVIIP